MSSRKKKTGEEEGESGDYSADLLVAITAKLSATWDARDEERRRRDEEAHLEREAREEKRRKDREAREEERRKREEQYQKERR